MVVYVRAQWLLHLTRPLCAQRHMLYVVGSNKVFKCCTPFYVAHRDKKGAFAILVKNLDA